MRAFRILKRVAVGIVVVTAVLLGGAGVAGADGSSWYAERTDVVGK